jgi:hypothetical protein
LPHLLKHLPPETGPCKEVWIFFFLHTKHCTFKAIWSQFHNKVAVSLKIAFKFKAFSCSKFTFQINFNTSQNSLVYTLFVRGVSL